MNEKQWYSYFHYAAKITKARFDTNDTTDLETLNKMGYPPKAVYHLLRMEEQLYKYSQGKSYLQVIQSDQKEFLTRVKRGKYTKKEAEEMVAAAYLNIQRTLSNIKPSKPDLQIQYKLYKLIMELEI
jgi:hypothetical protein